MKCFRINSTTIVFDDITMPQALKLKIIIENNPLLFSEVIGKNKIFSFIKNVPNTYYVENVDLFFKQLIEENFYTEDSEKRLDDPNQSLVIYLGYLIVEGFNRNTIEDLYSSEKTIEDTVNTLGESLYQKEIYEDILVKEYFDEYARIKNEAILAIAHLGLGIGLIPQIILESAPYKNSFVVHAARNTLGFYEIGFIRRSEIYGTQSSRQIQVAVSDILHTYFKKN